MTDRPNVLLIMSDQHNADVMGCAGDPVVRTPNLDAIAERGAVLENLYCQAPLCAPSRMSFLTGMLPSRTGVLTNEQMPSPAHPTFAHSAGAAGYRPYVAGKMHALGPDQLMGFTDRDVGDHGPNYRGAGTNAPVGRGALAGAMGPNLTSLEKVGVGRNAYQVRDEYAAEAAISHLRQHAIESEATGERTPFFVSVGLMLPHQPYVARAEDYARYQGRVPPPAIPGPTTEADDHPFLVWWREATGLTGIGGVPEAVVEKARTAYWAMVDRMDRIIGTVVDTVAEMGELDNTLIIYTSDHGDHVGEHGLWWKQTLLDPAAKVPGIVSWPGVVPAGTRLSQVCGLVDVAATIVDAVGGPELPRADGASLLPSLRDPANAPEGEAICEHCADRNQGNGLGKVDVPVPFYQRMVRSGRYKYVDHGEHPAQLFDLDDDPGETRNLADDPAYGEVVARLAARARDGWDPDRIMAETRLSIAESDVVTAWARRTQPPETHRWAMNPAYNALDEPASVLPGRTAAP